MTKTIEEEDDDDDDGDDDPFDRLHVSSKHEEEENPSKEG